jgi:hypothetical protein
VPLIRCRRFLLLLFLVYVAKISTLFETCKYLDVFLSFCALFYTLLRKNV